LKIEKVKISTLPYGDFLNIRSEGVISANFDIRKDTIYGRFEISDLIIQNLSG